MLAVSGPLTAAGLQTADEAQEARSAFLVLAENPTKHLSATTAEVRANAFATRNQGTHKACEPSAGLGIHQE